MRTFLALLVVFAPGCTCGASHPSQDDARGLSDAFTAVMDAAQPDAPLSDSGPRCVIDDSIPVEPTGCCERQGQRCTRDCGSFVTFCDNGCCLFTGP